MKDYASRYGRIRTSLAAYQGLIRTADRVITCLVFLSYPALLCYLFLYKREDLLRNILVPGISFVCISIIRKLINRKRPYETWDIEPLIEKESTGNSFPSRHLFSICIIAVCFFRYSPVAGTVLFVFAAAECFLRTAGGVHYCSDVLAGAAAGVLCGMILYL
jgi:membrane-associated phospholipid phosphatase